MEVLQDATKRTIGRILHTTLGTPIPRMWQILCILHLCMGYSVLCVRATGSGKTKIIHGAAVAMGNVSWIIVPLLALGADHHMNALELPDVLSFHLDELHGPMKAQVIAFLLALVPGVLTIIIWSSPQALRNLDWHSVLVHLVENDLLVLAAVDECHCVPLHGRRSFRMEFADLRKNFFDVVAQSPTHVPTFATTATLTAGYKDQYCRMMQCTFDYIDWGVMGRREINIKMDIRLGATAHITKLVKTHIPTSRSPRRVFVFTNEKRRAMKNLPDSIQKMLTAEDKEMWVAAVTSDVGIIEKSYIVSNFCSLQDSRDANIPVITATAGSASLGINCANCTAVFCDGLPEDMTSFAQMTGRAGRGDLPDDGGPKFEAVVVLNVSSWTFLALRINQCTVPADRRVQEQDCMRALQLLVGVPGECLHAALEKEFSDCQRGQKRSMDDMHAQRIAHNMAEPALSPSTNFEPCGDKCSYCLDLLGQMPPVLSTSAVVQALDTSVFARGDASPAEVVGALAARRALVWDGKITKSAAGESANLLVLQLIACTILCYVVVPMKADKSGHIRSRLALSWRVVSSSAVDIGDHRAHTVPALWKGIRMRQQ
jgi:superfamily II DNA helicase RecQ